MPLRPHTVARMATERTTFVTTSDLEQELLGTGAAAVVGVDEVGRGAWAGPLAVGAALLTTQGLAQLPAGVTDSKKLTAARRARLAPQIRAAIPTAVGWASAEEVDALGVSAALCLAGRRALADLAVPSGALILLDGSYNWLGEEDLPPVRTEVKGDLRCLSMACASVVAKVERDALMVELAAEHPGYGWERNAGYMSMAHRQAYAQLGLTAHHRRSWRIPPS